jgi:hypothetical protein
MPLAENHHPGRNEAPYRKLAGRLVPPAILLALVIGFYWKLTLTRQYTWLDSADLSYQVMPWYQFQAISIHQGHLPLWDPNHWGGQSLIGQVQPGTAYPLNWLLFLMPMKDARIRPAALNAYFVVMHFMAALFAYWLCRDLKRSRPASLLCGAAFGLTGHLGVDSLPAVLNAALWTPLVFLFLLRAVRGHRPWTSAALAGVFGGVSWLGGHHLPPMFLGLATLCVWMVFVFRGRRFNRPVATLAVVSLALTALVGAVQILPALEYGRGAIRWVGAPDAVLWNQPIPYSVHAEFSLGASSLLGILVPGFGRHASPYVGITAAALAFIGLAAGWRRWMVRLFAALGLAGLLFSLGGDNVFHGVLYSIVPWIEKARMPFKAMFLFHFAVYVLAAYGCDQLLRLKSAWPRRAALGLAVFGAVLYGACVVAAVAGGMKIRFDDRVVLESLVALLTAAALWGASHLAFSRPGVVIFLLALVLFDGGYATNLIFMERNRTPYLNKLSETKEAVDFLRRQPPPFRVEVDDEDFPHNLGDWDNLDHFGGYFPSLPYNLWRNGEFVPDRAALYGVAYRVTRKPPAAGQEQVFESSNGVKVYRNPAPFPRVWTVHETVGMPEHRNLDLRRAAFLPGDRPSLERCPGSDSASLPVRQPDRVEIEAVMACRGLVVLSDNQAPGWRAYVDGVRTEILPAYWSLRGVVVSGGRHRIVMVYRPLSVYGGALATLFGLTAALGIAFWERSRTALFSRRTVKLSS